MQEEKAVLLRPAFQLPRVLSLGIMGRCGPDPQEGREGYGVPGRVVIVASWLWRGLNSHDQGSF